MKTRLLGTACACTLGFITTAASATLVDKGDGLIYDTVKDITWSQPTWFGHGWEYLADIWAPGLTLGGVSGWRPPYISIAAGGGPFTGPSVDCSTATELTCRDNELGYVFYRNLSETYGSSITTSSDPDLALFPALQPAADPNDAFWEYWSATSYGLADPLSPLAWFMSFNRGAQGLSSTNVGRYVRALHDGMVHISPARYLSGTGLLELVGGGEKEARVDKHDCPDRTGREQIRILTQEQLS